MTARQTQHDLGNSALLQGLRAHLQPLAGDGRQYDGLLALIGPARFALLGEASHGTHEFYRERAEITKRLITEKGFTLETAVEAPQMRSNPVLARGCGDFRHSPHG